VASAVRAHTRRIDHIWSHDIIGPVAPEWNERAVAPPCLYRMPCAGSHERAPECIGSDDAPVSAIPNATPMSTQKRNFCEKSIMPRPEDTPHTRALDDILASGLDTALHQDPRDYRSGDSGFRRRKGHAIRGAILTRTDSGGETFTTWRIRSVWDRNSGRTLREMYFAASRIMTPCEDSRRCRNLQAGDR
jgi:hypothetical protein